MKSFKGLFAAVMILLLGAAGNLASAQSQGEVVSIARRAALSAARDLMDKVSPNTGRDADFDIDYESIVYDPYAKEIECNVTLSWTAKQYILSSSRRTCETWGKLYIDLSNGESRMKSRYVSKGTNSWFQTCADSHWADALANGIVLIVTK